MSYGVPQEVRIGPLLYVPYTASLIDLGSQHHVTVHQYADNIQLYLSVPLSLPPNQEKDEAATADRLSACIVDVEVSMKATRHGLNPVKAQATWLGPAQQRAKDERIVIPLPPARFRAVDTARNLGMVFGSQLHMSEHVASVC